MADCCENLTFVELEELGHVESVDWNLGKCRSCGSDALRSWSEYAPNRVFYDKLTEAEAAAFAQSRGRERVTLLKRWYADH